MTGNCYARFEEYVAHIVFAIPLPKREPSQCGQSMVHLYLPELHRHIKSDIPLMP